mgnify:CR=1 FL=1
MHSRSHLIVEDLCFLFRQCWMFYQSLFDILDCICFENGRQRTERENEKEKGCNGDDINV